MVSQSGNHALVIGASGLIGWAVVDQLLKGYPAPGTFRKVTAAVNRPLDVNGSYWLADNPDTAELSLASGVDLSKEDDEFAKLLRDKVHDIETISHIYYFAFKEVTDDEKEVAINVGMMRRVVRTMSSLSKNFKFFSYPGGTRGYGIYLPHGMFTAPLTEDLADNLPEDYAKTVSYPHYRAMLTTESANQSWTWSEVVPDAIVGFTPNGSGFSLAGHWATYLCAYKLVHGENAEVSFPGVTAGYDSLFTETSTKTLARAAIYASMHPEEFSERIFNVADSKTPSSMRERWPQIVSWFGLRGVPPQEGANVEVVKPSEFYTEHKALLEKAGVTGIEIWNKAQLDSYGYWLTFDRNLSLERLRSAGFREERRPEEGWWEAFEMFKKAGMI